MVLSNRLTLAFARGFAFRILLFIPLRSFTEALVDDVMVAWAARVLTFGQILSGRQAKMNSGYDAHIVCHTVWKIELACERIFVA